MVFTELRLAGKKEFSTSDYSDLLDLAMFKGITVEALIKDLQGDENSELQGFIGRTEEDSGDS